RRVRDTMLAHFDTPPSVQKDRCPFSRVNLKERDATEAGTHRWATLGAVETRYQGSRPCRLTIFLEPCVQAIERQLRRAPDDALVHHERRRPEQTTPDRLVQQHVETYSRTLRLGHARTSQCE
ncbi:hypothetical protein, partial [Paraburkholderia humisilvae]